MPAVRRAPCRPRFKKYTVLGQNRRTCRRHPTLCELPVDGGLEGAPPSSLLRVGSGVDGAPSLAKFVSTEVKKDPRLAELNFNEGRRRPALGVHHVDEGVDGAPPWGHSMSATAMSMESRLGKAPHWWWCEWCPTSGELHINNGVDGTPYWPSLVSPRTIPSWHLH